MRTVSRRLADLCENTKINLGRVGDNLHTQVRIDCLKLFEEYPNATAALTVRPPKGDPYPAVVVREGDFIIWNVTDSDLIYPGTGEAQLVFTAGEVVAHRAPFKTFVDRSIQPSGLIPTPVQNWVEQANEVLEEVRDAIPEGGTTGQVLAKASNDDYDMEWVDQSGGTSDYEELDNLPQIGGVTLKGDKTLNDLGAATEESVGAKYTKPSGGIPDTDLASGVQTSLGKADTAYQKPAGGIPAEDMASGVIPVLTDLIDDTAGDGDTNKVWSADKSSALLTEINSRYTKPNTGIPATDMAQAVQTSLGKADSAYQKPQTGIPATDMADGVIPDITGKADKTVTDELQKNKAPVIIDSATGNPIVLTDGADGLPVESMKIHFLPKQDTSGGDPSPSNVCPISGWTGVTAWVARENLFDEAYPDIDENMHREYVFVGNNTVYISTSCPVTGTGSALLFAQTGRATGGESTSGNGVSNNQARQLTPVDGWVTISYRIQSEIDPRDYETMLNFGTTRLPYTPYTGSSYPVTFPDGQTVYGGTLDAVNRVLTVWYRRIVADGTNVKVTGGYGNAGSEWLPAIVLSTEDKGVSNYAEGNLYASYLAYNKGSVVQTTENTICIASYGGIIALHIGTMQGTDGSHGYNSADELKTAVNAYLAEHNLEIVYKLTTPYEIQLNPITVQTLIGDNTIRSDANGTIELDYRADTKLFVGGYYKKPATGIPASDIESGVIPTVPAIATSEQIKTGTDSTHPIAPNRQNESVFYALAKLAGADMASLSGETVGVYPDAQKVAIQKMLGIYQSPWELIREDTVTNATETDVEITVDGDGNAFELTDVYLQVWTPQQETAASIGDYGSVRCFYNDNNSIGAQMGTWTQSANASAKYGQVLLTNENGAIRNETTPNATQYTLVNLTSRTNIISDDALLKIGTYSFAKITIKKVTGTMKYKLYGRRKWN